MGISLADAAAVYGADVELVLGPVDITPLNSGVRITHVTTAASMAEACVALIPGCEIAILSAAVADYTPDDVKEKKIKKDGNTFVLKLKPTTDIAEILGKSKKKSQIIAGFALETNNEIANARG